MVALVYFSRGLREVLAFLCERIVSPIATLARIEELLVLGNGMTMLPSEQEIATGRRGCVKTSSVGASEWAGGGVLGLFMVTSGASNRDRSSVGTSKGWAEVMHWVGVGGRDGDRSSMGGVGMGDGEGLCCGREWVDMGKEG
jgi:hypothetical protein